MSKRTGYLLCLILLVASPQTIAWAEAPPLERMSERLEERRADLIAMRRDLHQHPELSGEEKRTAGVVAQRLGALGFEVRAGVGGHGVVGLLKGGKPGPTVAFRADMDAVRSAAPDPVEFASKNPGIRHICGHDIHTSVGLALAEAFAAARDQMPGTLMLLFQPAEETGTGARAMLADGAFANPKPKAIFAVHTSPYPVGSIGTQPGVGLAGRDRILVDLFGEEGLDQAARAARAAIEGLNTLEPHELQGTVEGDFLAVQVMDSQVGRAPNSWYLGAVASSTTDAVRAKAEADLNTKLRETLPESVRFKVEYQGKWLAGVTNDRALEAKVRPALISSLGKEQLVVTSAVPPLFSEDFGSFQDEVPGVMYWLGVSNPEKGWNGMPHSPDYVADEEAIFVGAKAMAAVIWQVMAER